MTHQHDHCVTEAPEEVLTDENDRTGEGVNVVMNKGLRNENVLNKRKKING